MKINNWQKSIILCLLSGVLTLLFIELLLRLIPIPGIRFDVSKTNSLTGLGHYPNSKNFYRNDRGDFVIREINQWGFYDKKIRKIKEKGYYRIGFFGDSFTKAIQVPLEETFYYLINDKLKTYNVETLSFGVSGFSTLQSYLTCKKWVDFFDLDMIVYVFYENDLGDQIRDIKKSAKIPYPILKDDKLTIDNSFREVIKHRDKFYFRFFDFLNSKSLFFATISERIKLLSKHGIKLKVSEEDRYMRVKKNVGIKYPPNLNQGDSPSTWPESLRNKAMKLGEFIILQWKREISDRSKEFVILYTPKDIETPTNKQDSWKPWLEKFCTNADIPFIDPTINLLKMENSNRSVFYDHYTKHGHIAVANTFIEWYEEKNHNQFLSD